MQRRLQELVEKIPVEHLNLTEDLIGHIKTQIPQKLNESLLITLADHISFAILRKTQGVAFSNPLKGAIMCYYPTEYQLGLYCLKMIRQQLGVALQEDEAAFIALHIVNAELNTNMSEMYEITKLIEGTICVVEYFYQRKFDRESLDFSRFVVHLRYFAQRLFQDKVMEDAQTEQDELFRQLIMKNCKEHYRCAQCIADFVRPPPAAPWNGGTQADGGCAETCPVLYYLQRPRRSPRNPAGNRRGAAGPQGICRGYAAAFAG